MSGPVARVTPLDGQNGVRWEKVRTAKARISVEYYDREDVKQRVLDAVLRDLSRS